MDSPFVLWLLGYHHDHRLGQSISGTTLDSRESEAVRTEDGKWHWVAIEERLDSAVQPSPPGRSPPLRRNVWLGGPTR